MGVHSFVCQIAREERHYENSGALNTLVIVALLLIGSF
jgi:hypothetical protein